VDIAKLETTDNTPPAVTGGYLFSKDRVGTGDLTFTTTSGQQLIVLEPKSDAITQPQYDYLSGYVNAFEAALYGANWRDPLAGYAGSGVWTFWGARPGRKGFGFIRRQPLGPWSGR
jgi:hypothetical protein